jgi:hypothetical protein
MIGDGQKIKNPKNPIGILPANNFGIVHIPANS